PDLEVLRRQPDQGGPAAQGPGTGGAGVRGTGVGTCGDPVADRGTVPQQRVAHGRGGVDRLLVAELPRPGRSGVLAGLARVPLAVIPGAALRQVGEYLARRRLAEPAPRLGGEFELARGPLQVPLPLQFPLDLAQRLHVVHGLAAEGPA